jgi:hypothetical protein
MKLKWLLAAVKVLVVLIAAVSAWASQWLTYCKGDGCLGILVIYALAFALLLLQTFCALPLYALSLHRQGVRWGWEFAWWCGVSVSALAVPIMLGILIGEWLRR